MSLWIVCLARDVATAAHRGGKPRKYTGLPYITHPREVAYLCTKHDLPDEVIAAAWLHDTLEDTELQLIDLVHQFPADVVANVVYMTDAATDGNRATRKAAECARLATGTPDQQSLKLADLIDNTASIVEHDPKFAKTYLAEKRALLDALTDAKPSIRTEAETVWAAAMDRLGLQR